MLHWSLIVLIASASPPAHHPPKKAEPAAHCASIEDFKAAHPEVEWTQLTLRQFYWAEGIWSVSPATPAGVPDADKAWRIVKEVEGEDGKRQKVAMIIFSKGGCMIDPPMPFGKDSELRPLLGQVEHGPGEDL